MVVSKGTTYEVGVEDVEYLRHGDEALLARVFRPKGSGPFPIMVELHGGAWVRGTRENGDAANEALAKNGVIVVALDFRVPPAAGYPGSLADIHYGIRWCKTAVRVLERDGQRRRDGDIQRSAPSHAGGHEAQ